MKAATARQKRELARKKSPQVVLKDGQPSAVILDIEEYREMLERLQDADDMRVLDEMRKRPLKFRKLEDFLKDRPVRV
ncbi:MAG: type II toxin-antitoxin system Phd/YefM family antitoxin [Dehalococcoidia bacterium]|nr:type II toxin-antitoxin system Phd/YefM family antitoxin [Dehalococcoidia bacterium]